MWQVASFSKSKAFKTVPTNWQWSVLITWPRLLLLIIIGHQGESAFGCSVIFMAISHAGAKHQFVRPYEMLFGGETAANCAPMLAHRCSSSCSWPDSHFVWQFISIIIIKTFLLFCLFLYHFIYVCDLRSNKAMCVRVYLRQHHKQQQEQRRHFFKKQLN